MPTIMKKPHAKSLHFASFGLILFIIIVVLTIPVANNQKEAKEKFPKPLVEVVKTEDVPQEDNQGVITSEKTIETKDEDFIDQPAPPKSSNEYNIDITWGKFTPESLKLNKGSKVTWTHADDSKKFLIACYVGPNRVIKSENIFPGESFSMTFTEENEYLCIDAIYGARGFITVGKPVKEPDKIESIDEVLGGRSTGRTPGNSITGGVVNINNLQGGKVKPWLLDFSLDPLKRTLLSPISLNALATLAIMLFIISTLEYTVHLAKD